MSFKIILHPAAEADLQEAYEWYEQRETGLGAEFMRCVDSCLQLIRLHPEMYPTIHKHIRQGLVRRFPYSGVYFTANDHVIVTAIFHVARDPRIWKRRA